METEGISFFEEFKNLIQESSDIEKFHEKIMKVVYEKEKNGFPAKEISSIVATILISSEMYIKLSHHTAIILINKLYSFNVIFTGTIDPVIAGDVNNQKNEYLKIVNLLAEHGILFRSVCKIAEERSMNILPSLPKNAGSQPEILRNVNWYLEQIFDKYNRTEKFLKQ